MKKIIAACTLAVGVLGAANSFGAAPATSGPVFPVTINGTITYDPVGPSHTAYKSISSTVSPTLLTKNFTVASLIDILNHGYTSTNIIFDVTGLWQIPSDAYLVWTPNNEFGVGSNFLTAGFGFPESVDLNAGDLALVDAGGFYLPLSGTDPAVAPNPVYTQGAYSFATISFVPGVYSSAVDQTSLIGSESATVFFTFTFDDLNAYTDAWGDSFEDAFTVNGSFNIAISSTTDITKSTPVGIATDVINSASGTGYGKTATLRLGKNNHNSAVDLFNAPGVGGNAFIQATVAISGTSTTDTTVSGFFPVDVNWTFAF